MDETVERHVKGSRQGSKSQRLYIFSHMWKLDLKVKCTHKYTCDHMYVVYIIYMYIYNERENKIVLVGLSKGTMGCRRGKENVRE
jgi:hypothetical protein